MWGLLGIQASMSTALAFCCRALRIWRPAAHVPCANAAAANEWQRLAQQPGFGQSAADCVERLVCSRQWPAKGMRRTWLQLVQLRMHAKN
jgi:hypothetical protein